MLLKFPRICLHFERFTANPPSFSRNDFATRSNTKQGGGCHSPEQQNGRVLAHELLVMNTLTRRTDCKDFASGQTWLLGSAAEFPLVAAMLGVTLVLLCAPGESRFERLLTCRGASSLNEFCLLH